MASLNYTSVPRNRSAPLPQKVAGKVGKRRLKKARLSSLTHPEIKQGDAKKLDSADKRQAALELRLEGYSEYDIAEMLGVTQGRVSQMLKEVLEIKSEMNAMLGEEVRTMELERIDRMILAWYKRAKQDPRASDTLHKWIERRHKILPGIEITRQEISGANGGPIRLTSSHIDITKLNTRQLANLEEILLVAGPKNDIPDDMKLLPKEHEVASDE